MRGTWNKLLGSFGYQDWGALLQSLLPSLKYPGAGTITMVFSIISVPVIEIFGLDWLAFLALLVIFGVELISGVWAAKVLDVRSDEPKAGLFGFFDSWKFSRFTFKCTYYLLLIAISYLMSVSFEARGKMTAAVVFDYMHMFFTIQIVLENVVSISENLSTISGKPKSHWMARLIDKVNSMIG